MTETELNNLEVIKQCHEALNRADIEAAATCFAEDTLNHSIPVGREGVRMVLEDILETFPDIKLEIVELISADDSVIVRANFKGTHLGIGELPVNGGLLIGVEPTEKKFEVQHIHWYKLRDGKIIEHHANRDDVAMMQQLKLLPEVKFPAGESKSAA